MEIFQATNKISNKYSFSRGKAFGLAAVLAFLAGCRTIHNPTQIPLPPSPTGTSSPLPSHTATVTSTETPTKTPTETPNPYVSFSPFEKTTWNPESQDYLASLDSRQVAETGSAQEKEYIKEDQTFHVYYTRGLIDFLGKEGADVSDFKNIDLLVYNNAIKVYEALWNQLAKYPESYNTNWIPTAWLLRGDGKTNLGMYDPANLIILPSDKQGPGKYTLCQGFPFSTDYLINYYDPVGHNWETAKNKWFDHMRKFNNNPSVPISGLETPRIYINDDLTYGVFTALADHPGYPDGSVKIIFMGFQDENGKWVYQPFAVNLGNNKTKSGDYIDINGKVSQLSKDQEYPIPVVGSNFPTTLSRKEYTVADLIKMIGHQVYGKPNAFFEKLFFNQYYFDGIESFGVIFDGGKADISPLSPADATPSLTPTK
jgi:hypothetical protein